VKNPARDRFIRMLRHAAPRRTTKNAVSLKKIISSD
jgi:hypothetical protein